MAYSIKSLIENLLSELGKNDTQYKGKISKFLVDNNWFNIEIDLDNYSISDKGAQLLIETYHKFPIIILNILKCS